MAGGFLDLESAAGPSARVSFTQENHGLGVFVPPCRQIPRERQNSLVKDPVICEKD